MLEKVPGGDLGWAGGLGGRCEGGAGFVKLAGVGEGVEGDDGVLSAAGGREVVEDRGIIYRHGGLPRPDGGVLAHVGMGAAGAGHAADGRGLRSSRLIAGAAAGRCAPGMSASIHS